MLKRHIFVPLLLIISVSLAFTGVLLAQQETVLAQANTPEPAEEPTVTQEEEEPADTQAAPTATPMQEVAPTAAPVEEPAPTAAPAQEAEPVQATPATLPTTGMASSPLPVMWVALGTAAVLGVLSGIYALRRRNTQD